MKESYMEPISKALNSIQAAVSVCLNDFSEENLEKILLSAKSITKQTRFALAGIAYKKGNLANAFKYAVEIIERDPGNVWAGKMIHDICAKDSSYREAMLKLGSKMDGVLKA